MLLMRRFVWSLTVRKDAMKIDDFLMLLPTWKKNFALVTIHLLDYTDSFYKKFGPRSGVVKRRARPGSKLAESWCYSWNIVFEKMILKRKKKNDKKEEKSNWMNKTHKNSSVRKVIFKQVLWIITGNNCMNYRQVYWVYITKLWGIRLEVEGSRYWNPTATAICLVNIARHQL